MRERIGGKIRGRFSHGYSKKQEKEKRIKEAIVAWPVALIPYQRFQSRERKCNNRFLFIQF
jgi:hypothetical protein